MSSVASVLLALLIPMVWGLVSAWAFEKLRLRRSCETSDEKLEEGKKAE